MCNEKRGPLRSSKNQIDGAEHLFTHIVKYRVIIIQEVAHVARRKKESLISITHIVQGFWAKCRNRINSLFWYKAIVRCKHLVARILQHGFKLSSWLKVNKISNQIVHTQSATKFASMLQDIKKLQAWCKTTHSYCISDIAQKTTIANILTMLTQTY